MNNTISNNDSTATGEFAFGNVPYLEGTEGFILSPTALTTPMPSGIGIELFSSDLVSAMSSHRSGPITERLAATKTPVMVNNIITNNFAYYWNGYDPRTARQRLPLPVCGTWVCSAWRAEAESALLVAHGYHELRDTTTNIAGIRSSC